MKIIVAVFLLLPACESESLQRQAVASKVTHPIAESELPTVWLSPNALARLRVETTVVSKASVPYSRLVGGEVVVPPGRTIAVTAPVAGEVHFVLFEPPVPGSSVRRGEGLLRLTAIAPADRDTSARVVREVAAAEANFSALELRAKRNQALIEQGAGSRRAFEEATAARDVARADLEAAQARAATLSRDPLLSDVAMLVRSPGNGVIRVLSIAEGQTVAAGAPLFEIVGVGSLQVRVPVYSGDIGRVDLSVPARVSRNAQGRSVSAKFIPGPPTAEPDRSTVDRYLALPSDAGFAPGERVLIELPMRDQAAALLVPSSSVVLDAWGGAWVYRCEEQHFVRTRVDPVRRIADNMALAHGPPAGTCIVSVGAVELFGTEFPPGH